MFKDLARQFPACRAQLARRTWEDLRDHLEAGSEVTAFPELVDRQTGALKLPGYLADLARLELAMRKARAKGATMPRQVEQLTLNPSLELLRLGWRHLIQLVAPSTEHPPASPEKGEEFVIVWHDPMAACLRLRVPTPVDLLALKLMMEEEPLPQSAARAKVPVQVLDEAVHQAAGRGLLLAPLSRLRRDPDICSPAGRDGIAERFLAAAFFTVQWHITQTCDLHCKHCYDRSPRPMLELSRGVTLLRQLRDFASDRHVRAQVSFTGGNPLLHPHFNELYQTAADLGLNLAILGNPAPRARIEELMAIQRPAYYQVSLEGLPAHNDHIRGVGHFDRVLAFLEILRELGVYSMVMLTLTRDNIDQVLPLAETLRDRVDLFTFNRLSQVGEGASLHMAPRQEFAGFLQKYLDAAASNPIIGLKDNLLNIIRHQQGAPLFGGCAGHGCGAAFNFVSILADGEVHACRKFPSPIGNLHDHSLTAIYDSEKASHYRAGSAACRDCAIRPVCGGCLAVVNSLGLDCFQDRDPFCFMA